MIDRSRVRVPTGAAEEFSFPESGFCTDCYCGIRSNPVLPQQHVKRPRPFCQKCKRQVTAKHTCTPAPYLCGFEWSDTVNWWMVECTQNLRRNSSISRGTSHAATKERYQYTTSVVINNACYKRLLSLIQNHTRLELSESARGQRIAIYKTKSDE